MSDYEEYEEPTKHRSKKNRRDWCGGKVGREHVEVVQIPPNIPNYRGEYCRPAPAWAEGIGGRFAGWWCVHYVMCSRCGKHLRNWPSSLCPDKTLPPKN